MADLIHIRAVRPFYLVGQVVEPGAVVQACAVDASMAVSTGRAEFLTPEDRAMAKEGVIASDAKACQNMKVSGRSWIRRPFEL